MTSVIQKATSHYQNQIAGEMRSFEVPEWETTIYYRPLSTLKQEAEVVELTKQGKSVEALVVSIIAKARDAEGKLLFSKHDKHALMNEVDPNVILRVANQINGGDLPSIEDIEKN